MTSIIRAALATLDRPVYAPGRFAGKCSTAYFVVKQSGTYTLANNPQGGYTLYDVFIYVPLDDYPLLDRLAADVRRVLRDVSNLRLDNESPDLIEADYGALSRSLQYHAMTTID